MENVIIGDLVARLDRERSDALVVHLLGRSASREAGALLAPLFDRVLAEATAETRGLALHFERLQYFNSSTIAALVRFIRTALDSGVRITVVYDARQRWQAMSFDALRRTLHPLGSDEEPSGVVFAAA